MFDLQINNPNSSLKILKIDKVSKFDKVMRSTTEIHFEGLENEEYRHPIFNFFHFESQRKETVEIILARRSTVHVHLSFGRNCLSVENNHLRLSMVDGSGIGEFCEVLKSIQMTYEIVDGQWI
jgi:hypothetical protein